MSIGTKKMIASVLGWTSLLLMLGVVHGMETGTIRTGVGAALAFGLELFGAAALWKAGWIRWIR